MKERVQKIVTFLMMLGALSMTWSALATNTSGTAKLYSGSSGSGFVYVGGDGTGDKEDPSDSDWVDLSTNPNGSSNSATTDYYYFHAKPNEISEFSGWYNDATGGTSVSTATKYQYKPADGSEKKTFYANFVKIREYLQYDATSLAGVHLTVTGAKYTSGGAAVDKSTTKENVYIPALNQEVTMTFAAASGYKLIGSGELDLGAIAAATTINANTPNLPKVTTTVTVDVDSFPGALRMIPVAATNITTGVAFDFASGAVDIPVGEKVRIYFSVTDENYTFPDANYYELTVSSPVTISNSTSGLPTVKGKPRFVTINDEQLASKHLTVTKVTMNGATVAKSGNRYEVEFGTAVEVTFGPTEGYAIVSGESQMNLGTIAEDVTIGAATANLPVAELKPVALTVNASSLATKLLKVTEVRNLRTGQVVSGSGNVYTLTYGDQAQVTFDVTTVGYKVSGNNPMTIGPMTADVTLNAATANLPVAVEAGWTAFAFDGTTVKYSENGGYDFEAKDGSGDHVIVFTNVNEVSLLRLPSPNLFKADVLGVAGGGAGGTQAVIGQGGGGGGAGGFNLVTNETLMGYDYFVYVGHGGARPDDDFPGATNGTSGKETFMTNAYGTVVVSAYGGGGGGASTLTEVGGSHGGSGGGGAWVGDKATPGGAIIGVGGGAHDGQGNRGGTPAAKKADGSSNVNNGGGGGGAGAAGGTLGEAGAGRVCEITGESVLYAQGGAGGSNISREPAKDAVGFGFGGDGGNGGHGGAGANGVVIVRLKRTQPIKLLDYPKVVDEFQLDSTHKTYRAFDPEVSPWTEYKPAVAEIKGTNKIENAYISGSVTNGVGHYRYSVVLNEGYSWKTPDGDPYGSTQPFTAMWRAVADTNEVDATIKVTKDVLWDADGSNGTICVTSHSTPKQNPKVPNVLFLGTLCDGHNLGFDTIQKSLNAVAGQANLDYYFANSSSIKYQDTINKGGTFNETWNLSSGTQHHEAIEQFYLIIHNAIEKRGADYYDYIVFEFDGTRLAHSSDVSPYEQEVSQFLIDYYEKNHVIWILDDGEKGRGSWGSYKVYPWTPDRVVLRDNGDSGTYTLSDNQFRSLLGLFNPDKYASFSKSTVGTRIDNEIGYSDSSTVADYLKTHIVPVAYNVTFEDTIKQQVGINVKSIESAIVTNGAAYTDAGKIPAGEWLPLFTWKKDKGITWKDEELGITKDLKFAVDANKVELSLTNLVYDCWTRLNVHIQDDGTFKTSEHAEYNYKTGLWEANPNKGEAGVYMVNEQGERTDVYGEAETSFPLAFPAYQVTVDTDNGQAWIDGSRTNAMYIGERSNGTVTYRGLPGYEMATLQHNGAIVLDWEKYLTQYPLVDINSEHHLYVGYTNYVGEVSGEDVRTTYDGTVVVPAITVGDWTNGRDVRYTYSYGDDENYYPYEEFAEKYTNRLEDATCEELADNMPTNVIRWAVEVSQPGWGNEGRDLAGSGYVQVFYGTNSTMIAKRPLNVTAWYDYPEEYAEKQAIPTDVSTGWDSVKDGCKITIDEAAFVAGEGVDLISGLPVTFTCETYKTGESGQYEFTFSELTADNYRIVPVNGWLNVGKGTFKIGGKQQHPGMDPEKEDTGVKGVWKFYDRVATNITVNVDFPQNESLYTIKYAVTNSTDIADAACAEWSEVGVNPVFSNACDTIVWYAVEATNAEDYFAVTNYAHMTIAPRPIYLRSEGGTWKYDEIEHSTNDVKVVLDVDNDKLDFLPEEPFKIDTISYQQAVGSRENKFAYEPITSYPGWEDNYDFHEEYGTLKVEPHAMVIGGVTYPDDTNEIYRPFPFPTSNGVEWVEKVYDGVGTNIMLDITLPDPTKGYQLDIRYATDDTPTTVWSRDFALTNAYNGPVYFAITDPLGNYVAVTNHAFVTIKARPAKVTAVSRDEFYNAETLKDSSFKAEPFDREGERGFVEGEGVASVTMTDASAITTPGAVSNEIAIITFKPNTLAENYAITTNQGELIVRPRPITLATKDLGKVHDSKTYAVKPGLKAEDISVAAGDYAPGEGSFGFEAIAPLTTQTDECKLEQGAAFIALDNGATKTNNYAITYQYGQLTIGGENIYIGGHEQNKDDGTTYEPGSEATGVKPVIVEYDGTPHAITVDVTYPESYDIHFSTNGTTWVDGKANNYAFTDVTLKDGEVATNFVWYAVEAENFKPVTNKSWVVITPRKIEIEADDVTIAYGETLSEATYKVDRPVEGDDYGVKVDYAKGKEFDYTPGESPYAITTNEEVTITRDGADIIRDYNWEFIAGTLTVTQRVMTVAEVLPVEKEWDGVATNVLIKLVKVPEGAIIEFYDETTGTWLTAEEFPGFADVGDHPVKFRVRDPEGNWATYEGESVVRIGRRKVKVTAKDITRRINTGNPSPWPVEIRFIDTDSLMSEADMAELIDFIHVQVTYDEKIGKYEGAAVPSVKDNPGSNLLGETYIVEKWVAGTLTITAKEKILYEITHFEGSFDGKPHTIKVAVTNDPAQVAGAPIKIEWGWDKDGPWSEPTAAELNTATSSTQVVWTEVTEDAGKAVWFRITIGDGTVFETETDYGHVIILDEPPVDKPIEIGGKGPFGPMDEYPPPAPNEPGDDSESASGVRNVTKLYDGEGTNITVTVTDPAGAKPYFLVNGKWTQTEPVFVHAGTNTVWYKIEEYGYYTVSNYAYVVIQPRTVGFETGDKTFVYNGEAQAYTNLTITGDGFAKGEGVVTNGFTEVTNVTATSVENVFDYKPTAATALAIEKGDYVFLEPKWGLLDVIPAQPGDPDEPSEPEDPDPKDPPPFNPDDPQPPTPPTGDEGEHLNFSDYDYNKVYDGYEHTLDETNLWNVVTNQLKWAGDVKPVIEYSTTGKDGSWQPKPFTYTDVVSTSFWYRVTAQNYSNYVHAVGITITHKDVKVSGKQVTKPRGVADPEDVKKPEITGLVREEPESLIKYKVEREEGEDVGSYTIFVTADEIQGNYKVSTEDGELQILDRDISVKAENIVYVYNGMATNPVIIVENEVTEKTIEFWNGNEWSTKVPKFQNVIDTLDHRTNISFRVTAKDGKETEQGELHPKFGEIVISIQPREITLTMGNGNHQDLAKQKVYDGTPLWGTKDDIQVGGMGYAPGEEFLYGWFTNRIEVGINPSSFDWHDNPGSEHSALNPAGTLVSNYTVTPEYGWLKILPPENSITIYSENAIWSYDGKHHPYDVNETNKYYRTWLSEDYAKYLLDPADKIEVTWKYANLTTKGLALNDFDYKVIRDGKDDVTKEYEKIIIKAAGTFEMKDGTIRDGIDVVGHSAEIIYNGEPTNAWVEILNPLVKENLKKVSYSLDKATWTTDNPPQTHVTDGPVRVWYAVEANNFTAFTNMVPMSVNVKRRPVEFESLDIVAKTEEAPIPSAAKPLVVVTNVTDTTYAVIPGDEFAFTSTSTLSAAGDAPAAFRWDAPEAVSNDYTVTLKYGQLIIGKEGELIVRAKSKDFTYTGNKETCHEAEVMFCADEDNVTLANPLFTDESFVQYPTAEGEWVPNEITNVTYMSSLSKEYEEVRYLPGKLTMKPAKFTDVTVTSENVVYDGKGDHHAEAHTSVTGAKIAYNTTGPKALYWDEPPMFRNADVYGYPVYFQITAKGYETYYGMTNVVIRPRALTLYSVTETNEYDGAAFTTSGKTDAVWAAGNASENAGLVGNDKLANAKTVPSLTDAGKVPNSFTYTIVNEDYPGEDLSANYFVTPVAGQLVVTPAPFDLKLTVNDKPYDALADAEYKTNNLAEISLPVPGDGTKNAKGVLALDPNVIGKELKFFFDNPLAGTGKAVTNNTFRDSWVITNMPGVVRNNYALGKVTVEKASIWEGNPGDIDPEDPFDPKFPPEVGPFPGPELPELPVPTNCVDGTWSRLSNYDVVTNYDGEAHTFNTNALMDAIALIADKDDYYHGNKATIEYSLDGTAESWTNEPYAWVNVCDTPTSFWYRVSIPNFTNYIHAVGVTILPKDMGEDGIVANNVTNCYGHVAPELDGHGWTEPKGLVAPDYVASVAFDWTNKSAVATLPVGTYDGFISTNKLAQQPIVISNETEDVTANYKIKFIPGKLVITNASAYVASIPDSTERFYTGEPWEPLMGNMVTNNVGKTIPESEYKTEYFNNTNATEKGAYVVVTFTNNYAGVYTNYFTINKRKVMLEADSAKKPYDGTALTTNGYTVVKGIPGYTNFVALAGKPAEGLTNVALTAMTSDSTITLVGTTNNVIDKAEIAYNAYTLETNYELSYKDGTLEIEAGHIDTPEPPENPDDPIPGPPEEGGEVTLWATNVVMTYNGTGTNISAQVYNAPADNDFRYEYSTNNWTTFFTDDDHVAFTNVLWNGSEVGSYQVWYRAVPEAGCNYVETNCYAWVTILPAKMSFGPDEGGNNHEQDPDDLKDPDAYDDDSGTANGVRNVFTEWYSGIATNIIVKVVPPTEGVTITYGTNSVEGTEIIWVGEDLAFTMPILSNQVWYAVSAPNYQSITNYGYVTLYKAEGDVPERSDVDVSDDTKELLEQCARRDQGKNDHPYVKIQMTIVETNNLSDATRTSPELAAVEAAALIALAEQGGTKVTYSKFYDVILERTYNPVVAMAEEYDWRDWESIGEADKHPLVDEDEPRPLLEIKLPFDEQEGKAFMGVWVSHMTDDGVVKSREALRENFDSENPLREYFEYNKDARDEDGRPYVTIHVRNFSIYGLFFMDAIAKFSATVEWEYYSGNWIAKLNVTNGNTSDGFNYVENSMRFLFDERTNSTNETKATLWNPWSQSAQTNSTLNGVKYPTTAIADPEDGWPAHVGETVSYGPAEGATSKEKVLSMKTTPVIRAAKDYDTSLLTGWLVWESNGKTYSSPIVADSEMSQKLAEIMPEPIEGTPLTLDELNLALQLGEVIETSDEALGCRFTAFSISNDVEGVEWIYGQIAITKGTEDLVMTKEKLEKLTVKLLWSDDLKNEFKPLDVSEYKLDALNFEFKKPAADAKFYKASVGTRETVVQ